MLYRSKEEKSFRRHIRQMDYFVEQLLPHALGRNVKLVHIEYKLQAFYNLAIPFLMSPPD